MSRPHCLNVAACVARRPNSHCVKCAANTPETRAKKSAGILASLERPETQAKRAAASAAVSSNHERAAKISAAMKRRYKNPEHRHATAEACRRGWREALADPAFAEEQRQRGMILNDPENRRRQGEARNHWCPPELRDDLATLRAARLPVAEIKRIIRERTPGTPEHGKAEVERHRIAMAMRHAKDIAQRY